MELVRALALAPQTAWLAGMTGLGHRHCALLRPSPALQNRMVEPKTQGTAILLLGAAIRSSAYSTDEVVKRIRARLKSIDAEGSTNYTKEYPAKKLREVIRASLERIGETRDLVSEQNMQQLFRAIGNIHRTTAKAVRIKLQPKSLELKSTRDMPTRSVALMSFMKEAKVFFDSLSPSVSLDEDRHRLEEIAGDESDYPGRAWTKVANSYLFKSPVNVVLSTHAPERNFTRRLFETDVASQLNGWVKAPDVGWYGIAFSWRKGDHTIKGRFFPDYVLRLAGANDVLFLEIKADGDDGDENKAKLRFAQEHFERINSLQQELTYHMKFVSPVSYDAFFQALKKGQAAGYVSALQAALTV
jgi:type III restriction enzyme